ncbi:hypothetical protein MMPV_003150 [Pyropia vietnamensis]
MVDAAPSLPVGAPRPADTAAAPPAVAPSVPATDVVEPPPQGAAAAATCSPAAGGGGVPAVVSDHPAAAPVSSGGGSAAEGGPAAAAVVGQLGGPPTGLALTTPPPLMTSVPAAASRMQPAARAAVATAAAATPSLLAAGTAPPAGAVPPPGAVLPTAVSVVPSTAAATPSATPPPVVAPAPSGGVPRPLPPPARRPFTPWPFGRYVTAPMVDASELPFRLLNRRHGVSLAYTPMFHAALFASSPRYRAEHWTTTSADRPLAVQFCANDPATFVAAARHVDNGEVDFIDLNLGCPQGIARKGHYGAFLQDEWPTVAALISTAARELKTPVSAKIRIFSDVAKTVAYARMIEDAGASVLAVHGRTREQKGRTAGPADWEVIRAVKAALTIPVLANGNVRHRGDADACIATTGADGVLSAVWLLENPALFEAPDADAAALADRMALAEEYLTLVEAYPVPMRCVRAHLFKLMRSRLNTCMEENGSLGKARTLEEFWGVLRVLREKCDVGEQFEVRQVRLRREAAEAESASVTKPPLEVVTQSQESGQPPQGATAPPGAVPLAEDRTNTSAHPVPGQKRPREVPATAASLVLDG